MRLAKKQQLGARIHIDRAEVLRAMQRSIGTSEYQWLEDSIDRLHQASLKIETTEYKSALHLVNSYLFKKETGGYCEDSQ
ncbi:MAG: replication initiator protein A [Herminiimonas sp.]|nr:replication initiator protein A [Herminiimonas sp.]